IRIPFFAVSERAVSERRHGVAQVPPYQALKEAPTEIRQAATVALVCSSVSRAIGILTSTIIIATLPTLFPGLLAFQPIPILLLVLFIGYTQLPTGLGGVSDWLSPVLGVHFNTLIVAVYLIFTNPLTYPPVFQLWITAGLLGGIIAGGKVGRGFMVGLAVFLSTLGAMGLAALSIFRGVTSGGFSNIPPPPPGFSLI